MTDQPLTRPVPVADEMSAPYWHAAREHLLVHARCSNCHLLAFPVSEICAHCSTTTPDFSFEPVSGDGVIRSWTIVRQSFVPGFGADLPFALVDVELAAQAELRMIGRLLGDDGSSIRLGDPVTVVFEDLPGGESVPAFALVSL